MDNDDENMLCLSVPEKVDTNDDFPSSDDSDIEVTSTINEEENELDQIGNNLCFNSDDSTDDDMNIQDNSTVQSYPATRTSEDDENYDSDHIVDNSSSRLCSLQSEASDTPSRKRKRRAWSVKDKLRAIENYEKFNSKYSTAKAIGCTRHQLSEWLKIKEELYNLQSLSKGGQRKRLKGGGHKIKYTDLDDSLFKWFNEHRTPPTLIASTIRHEKITFKKLFRQGTNLSTAQVVDVWRESAGNWKQYSSWKLPDFFPVDSDQLPDYKRFMIRHRLSLQRPKRNQKIPLLDAHEHATLFYDYLREASKWGPKRGPMGAFVPRDVCNFDESPLALFGDQTKRSINNVNVDNEVEGNICSKVSSSRW
ncbi:unnamed protein product [Rotaria socialis]